MILQKLLKMYKNKITLKDIQQKKFFDDYTNRILPATLIEKKTHLIINEGHNPIYVRTVVGGIPPDTGLAGYSSELSPRYMAELQEITDYQFSISFTAIPIPDIETLRQIDRAKYLIRVQQEGYKDPKGIDKTQQPPALLGMELKDLENNEKIIYTHKEGMFHTAHIITVYGYSVDELNSAESQITTIMESNGVYFEIPDYRHKDTFFAALPTPETADHTWCEAFSEHVALLMGTTNTNSHTDDDGLLLASDLKTSRDVLVNLHNMILSHMLIIAPSGWGKTFFLMLLAMRIRTQLDDRIIYVTVKPEPPGGTNYRGTCAKLLGSIIDLGVGKYTLNPLQVLFDRNSLEDRIGIFDAHFDLLVKFFQILFEGVSINMKSFLGESLIEVYRRKGIVRHIPETWVNCNDWPTLLDLRVVWEEIARDPRELTAKALYDKSFLFTTSWGFLNKPTSLNLENNFIVIDLSNIPESIRDALNVFVTGLMSLRFRGDNEKRTVIEIDEGRSFLSNKDLTEWLINAITRGRSARVTLVLTTQNSVDVTKSGLKEEINNNMPISIIGGMLQPKSIKPVQDFFNLDESITEDLLTCNQGEGVLIIGQEQMTVKFEATEYEYNIIKGNDQEQIASSANGIKLKNNLLLPLIDEGIIIQNWIEGDDSKLQDFGYESHRIQNAVDSGMVRAWIKKDLIINSKIHNQSIDHFGTVIQTAGYLMEKGSIVRISHQDGSDISTKIAGQDYKFEYEHGIQSPEILQKKKHDTISGRLVFIGQSTNIKYLYKTVGEENVIKRGKTLANFLDDIIELKPQEKQESKNILASFPEVSEEIIANEAV
jgi:hypothetical protein